MWALRRPRKNPPLNWWHRQSISSFLDRCRPLHCCVTTKRFVQELRIGCCGWQNKKSEHRRKTEATIISAQIEHYNKQFSEARCGQICALIITLVALAGGVYTALQGHEVAGSIIGVGGIGGIVTTFILGRRSNDATENGSPQEKHKNEPAKNNKKKRRK